MNQTAARTAADILFETNWIRSDRETTDATCREAGDGSNQRTVSA